MNPSVEAAPPEDKRGDDRWMSMHKRFLVAAREQEPDVLFLGDYVVSMAVHTESRVPRIKSFVLTQLNTDVFPTPVSTRLVPVSHPGKQEPFEYLMHLGAQKQKLFHQYATLIWAAEKSASYISSLAFSATGDQLRVRAFVTFMDASSKRIFHPEIPNWSQNRLQVDNFKRTVLESAKVKFFDKNGEKVAKKLQSNPPHEKKTTDQRLSFQMDNLFLVKQCFSFGLRKVEEDEGHVNQTTQAPIWIYHLTDLGKQIIPTPLEQPKSLVVANYLSYDRDVLLANSTYVVPTQFLILTFQKNLFAVDQMAWEQMSQFQDSKYF